MPTLELRATMSLSRFLWDAGRGEEATRALAPASEAFEKSAITPDLTEARRVLDARK
jgi:predicted ATPase